jgi:hypothetical protein
MLALVTFVLLELLATIVVFDEVEFVTIVLEFFVGAVVLLTNVGAMAGALVGTLVGGWVELTRVGTLDILGADVIVGEYVGDEVLDDAGATLGALVGTKINAADTSINPGAFVARSAAIYLAESFPAILKELEMICGTFCSLETGTVRLNLTSKVRNRNERSPRWFSSETAKSALRSRR